MQIQLGKEAAGLRYRQYIQLFRERIIESINKNSFLSQYLVVSVQISTDYANLNGYEKEDKNIFERT